MTMFCIDTMPVVFEGTARLRWRRLPEADSRWTWPMGPDHTETVLGAVWPDDEVRRTIQRRASTRGRMVVVFDGSRESTSVSRQRVPRVPDGVRLAECRDPERVLLEVQQLTWLPEPDRLRGLAFREEARSASEKYSRPGSPPILLETKHLNSAEPLRFLYRKGPLSISDLLTSISCLYGVREPVVKLARSTVGVYEMPTLHAA